MNWEIPDNKKTTCFISHLTDRTGYFIESNGKKTFYPSDMDSNVHKGITIGRGKTLYWDIIWHSSGNVTVYSIKNNSPRYLSGDAEITLHFK